MPGFGRPITVRYSEFVNVSRISKIAGFSFAGFVVATVVADKVNLNSNLAQLAGFAGAFAGTLMGRLRKQEPAVESKSTDAKEAEVK